ncbi:hypothetical protein [Pseudomonas syringae group genomosp. 3]|uniref:hypothetical protein n=1 Tax=Pseudomonas syringae group genomosp. 3 TaxID=251701 RepID=UPI0013520782|nr:hypothetical protein [Pseudomonas syringae group genomosp. 3]
MEMFNSYYGVVNFIWCGGRAESQSRRKRFIWSRRSIPLSFHLNAVVHRDARISTTAHRCSSALRYNGVQSCALLIPQEARKLRDLDPSFNTRAPDQQHKPIIADEVAIYSHGIVTYLQQPTWRSSGRGAHPIPEGTGIALEADDAVVIACMCMYPSSYVRHFTSRAIGQQHWLQIRTVRKERNCDVEPVLSVGDVSLEIQCGQRISGFLPPGCQLLENVVVITWSEADKRFEGGASGVQSRKSLKQLAVPLPHNWVTASCAKARTILDKLADLISQCGSPI